MPACYSTTHQKFWQSDKPNPLQRRAQINKREEPLVLKKSIPIFVQNSYLQRVRPPRTHGTNPVERISNIQCALSALTEPHTSVQTLSHSAQTPALRTSACPPMQQVAIQIIEQEAAWETEIARALWVVILPNQLTLAACHKLQLSLADLTTSHGILQGAPSSLLLQPNHEKRSLSADQPLSWTEWLVGKPNHSGLEWRCTGTSVLATHMPFAATAGVPTPGNTESPQHHTFSSGCTAFGRAPVRFRRLAGPYVPHLRRKKRACERGVPMHVTLTLSSMSGMICMHGHDSESPQLQRIFTTVKDDTNATREEPRSLHRTGKHDSLLHLFISTVFFSQCVAVVLCTIWPAAYTALLISKPR
jgi:hypothetical protein